MVNFWNIVNKVIEDADIIIEVLDARFPELTRNKEVENKVLQKGKKLLYVINKADLSEEVTKQLKVKPFVLFSAKKHYGTNLLREALMKISKGESVRVGVLGYPNVGKSSVINALKGRGSAPVSPKAGFTKHKQTIRASGKIIFLDTPGVIPFKEQDKVKHAIISSTDFTKVKEPDMVVMEMMKEYPGVIEKYYGVDVSDDLESVIENIAMKTGKLKKQRQPDIERCSRDIIKDWQRGKIMTLYS